MSASRARAEEAMPGRSWLTLELMMAGSWETSRDAVPDYVTQVTVCDEASGERVATVFREDAVALIAAAPNLLEALVAVELVSDDIEVDDDGQAQYGNEMQDAWALVRDAIRKATGDDA